jgi:hypothetical protein
MQRYLKPWFRSVFLFTHHHFPVRSRNERLPDCASFVDLGELSTVVGAADDGPPLLLNGAEDVGLPLEVLHLTGFY